MWPMLARIQATPNARRPGWRARRLWPAVLAALALLPVGRGAAAGAADPAPERVVLQLKWTHQFQFAGYYAAKAKGFFREAGLEVEFREGHPGMAFADEVVSGRADYGVEMPILLLERQRGKPVVVLAAIYQHSPEILITLEESGIETPQQLVGRRVELRREGTIAIKAMLLSEGIPLDAIQAVNHSWGLDALISGAVDASAGYVTDRPFFLRQQGIPYNIIRPVTYGIDFYGDTLFTSEREIREHPERVEAFLGASLRGWAYALENPEEVIDLILREYNPRLTRDFLRYEAAETRKLMMPRFIEIGHMSPGRWKHIAETFARLGLLRPDFSLDGFLYRPNGAGEHPWVRRALWSALALSLVLAGGAALLFLFNKRLKRAVAERTEALSRANELLAESEQKYREIFNSTSDAIFIHDARTGAVLDVNQSMLDMYGFSRDEIPSLDIEKASLGVEPFGPQEARELVRSAARHDSRVFEWRARRKNGELFWAEVSLRSSRIGGRDLVIAVVRDVTERRRMEEHLRHALKMEAIGRLSGGIAHDFNNLLTAILGYSEMALRGLPDDDPLRKRIQAIHDAGERAAALTHQLLAFSRKQVMEMKVVDLNGVIGNMARLLRRLIGEDVDLTIRVNATRSRIRGDVGQLEQIVMNLALNARDAMPRGGRLVIATEDAVLDEEQAASHADGRAGAYVVLTVADTGVGMTEEVREHLFEPFFTTKETGKGTGLGLAMVYGVVKQHGGHIQVETEPGAGTTFRIYLPATDEREEERSDPKAPPAMHGGTETVLVVDDDSSVLRLIADTLRPLGYRVLEASRGEEALALCRSRNPPVDLLLTDVIMPGMNGRELAEACRRVCPGIRVMFMSGYTDDVITHLGVLEEGVVFLTKPLRPSVLSARLRAVLDHEPPAAATGAS